MSETILDPSSGTRIAPFKPSIPRVARDLQTLEVPEESTVSRPRETTVSPETVDSDCSATCRRRALCRCAHQQWLAAQAVEHRIWTVLTLCGAVTILYAVYCFFRR
jgi:hypothetical protein